jgi:hypothetical protein
LGRGGIVEWSRGSYVIFVKYNDVVEEDDGVETRTNSRTVKTVKRISTG